ncbi:hypothetical protein [Qipengyuania flava]|uniref:hypothetical protein n=1 Tax=Qipengyuania flava TaxID=192812 RepID=UPI001CD5D9EC|nr:hypothetical protein [Qipengyuania flava]MCA0891264.1 hypothetical protein [Qipengyuania flava]
MGDGDIELKATIDRFTWWAKSVRLDPDEIGDLVGVRCPLVLLNPPAFRSSYHREAETRIRLVLALREELLEYRGSDDLAGWLRERRVDVSPLEFMAQGIENVRALLAATRYANELARK